MDRHILMSALLIGLCIAIALAANASESDILSDEEFAQEIEEFVCMPCIKTFWEGARKFAPKLAHFTDHEIELLIKNAIQQNGDLQTFRQALEKSVIERQPNIKSLPEESRKLFYKLERLGCTEHMKKIVAKEEQEQDESPSLTGSTPIAPTPPSDSVPAHIREKALRNCKQQYEALDSIAGTGMGSSWTMLKLCVDGEIRAYKEFQREYGQ